MKSNKEILTKIEIMIRIRELDLKEHDYSCARLNQLNMEIKLLKELKEWCLE